MSKGEVTTPVSTKEDTATKTASTLEPSIATLTIMEHPAESDPRSTPKVLEYIFETLTLGVSTVLLLVMVIFPVTWLMFYLAFALMLLAGSCGAVAIRARMIWFHIPCMICAILASLNFLSIIVSTLIMIFVMEQEWEYEHLIVYIAFNAIWFAVAVALVVRHIIIFRQRRALKNAQPLSYKSFEN